MNNYARTRATGYRFVDSSEATFYQYGATPKLYKTLRQQVANGLGRNREKGFRLLQQTGLPQIRNRILAVGTTYRLQRMNTVAARFSVLLCSLEGFVDNAVYESTLDPNSVSNAKACKDATRVILDAFKDRVSDFARDLQPNEVFNDQDLHEKLNY